jgi:hypothetical protein
MAWANLLPLAGLKKLSRKVLGRTKNLGNIFNNFNASPPPTFGKPIVPDYIRHFVEIESSIIMPAAKFIFSDHHQLVFKSPALQFLYRARSGPVRIDMHHTVKFVGFRARVLYDQNFCFQYSSGTEKEVSFHGRSHIFLQFANLAVCRNISDKNYHKYS